MLWIMELQGVSKILFTVTTIDYFREFDLQGILAYSYDFINDKSMTFALSLLRYKRS